eukprot:403371978
MQNIVMINEYMRKKKDGLTLGEKIHQHLDQIKKLDLVDLLEAFFTEEKDRGTQFYVRRADFMQDKRYKLVIDEIEERLKAQKIFEEEEAKRDMTYEEFLGKYIDHIEGKVDADARSGNRPLTADDNQDVPAQASAKNQSALANQSNQFEENKGEDEIQKATEKLNESNISRGKSRGEDQLNKSKDSILSKDDYKFEIPQDCIMSIIKGNQIHKLSKKYLLLSHPQPKIEGEMILFQPLKQDQYDPQVVVYRDYSLRKRLATRPRPKKLSSYQQKKVDTEDKEQSKLRCLEIDLRQPLSTIDWQNFATVLSEVQGLGFVSILPVGEKSSTPYQHQLMHILPNSKIPFQSLPLDLLITAKVQFVKLQQEQALEEARQLAMSSTKSPVKGKDGKEAIKKPENSNIIKLDEYNFPHAVYIYESNHMKEEILHNGFNKIHQYLDLDDHPDVGLVIIISPSWMFVATLTGPYASYNGSPVYADPYAYLGIMNIQKTVQEWPATAGLESDVLSPYEILERSSQYGRPEHDQILGQ